MESNTTLLEALNPVIETAYDEHMRLGTSNQREPLYPPEVLAKAAGITEEHIDSLIEDILDEDEREKERQTIDRLDPMLYTPILRENFQANLRTYEDSGIDIKSVLAATFLVNLLTEDNLPYYTEKNLYIARNSEALTTWVKEWVAEEDEHGTLMRDYALAVGLITSKENKLVSHQAYHTGRTKQLRTGTDINPDNHEEAFHYLTLQEDLTKDAHKMLSWMLDKSGIRVITPMIGDENRHRLFYQKLSRGTLDLDDFVDSSLIAMDRAYTNFDMPGQAGIPHYKKLAYTIALSGIFDLETIARSKRNVATGIDVESKKPKTDAGKRAQENILNQTSPEAIESQRDFMEKLRDLEMEKTRDGKLLPFIIGRTVDFEYSGGITPQRTGLVITA